MEKEEITRGELFKDRNLPLILTSYNDIFSSFDPRPYSERALSDDFLFECKRAALDKVDEGIEIILSVPKSKRNSMEEMKIKNRLRAHFHKHYHEKMELLTKLKITAWIWTSLGLFFMLVSALLVTYISEGGLLINLLEGSLVPAGWFFFWEGLDKLLIETKEREPDYKFYKKMSNAHILFRGY